MMPLRVPDAILDRAANYLLTCAEHVEDDYGRKIVWPGVSLHDREEWKRLALLAVQAGLKRFDTVTPASVREISLDALVATEP